MCCKEINEMVNRIPTEGVQCIILHPGIQSVCLSSWVLEPVYYGYRQQYTEDAIKLLNCGKN